MIFLLPTVLLSLFGLLNLLGIKPFLVFNQGTNVIFGLVSYLIVIKIGKGFFYQNIRSFFWLFTILLLVTLFFGLEIKGARRWLDFYLFRFQTSEFFKVFYILFLADFFSSRKDEDNKLKVLLLSLSYFLIPVFLVFKEPDLGNTLSLVAIYGCLLFFSGIPRRYIWYIGIFLLLFSPLGWHMLRDYQRQRLIAFINPHIDQKGVAYNMVQAMITVGSGKFFGRGLGLGTQSRLFFLPENHTDFAFAALVEQFGFLGGLIVIFLYLTIVILLVRKLLDFYQDKKEGFFNFLVCLGFLVYVVFQVIVNIGMNLGIMPVAGISLPLISYGGSAIVSFMIGLALLPD